LSLAACRAREPGDRQEPSNQPKASHESVESTTVSFQQPPELPTEIQRILADSLPGFVLWTMDHYEGSLQSWLTQTHLDTPWQVLADFNGDGVQDAVVDGHIDRRALRVALVSDRTGYRFMRLRSDSLSDLDVYSSIVYLAPVKPGTIDTLACDSGPYCEDAPFHLTHDGFEEIFFGKGSSVYYWARDSFAASVTSD
jgi:hypothetical protein